MCDHIWERHYEQSLLGGAFLTGYQCEKCGQWVGQYELTPAGLGGTMGTKQVLVGPHHGHIDSASGRPSRRQVYDAATGKLEYLE